MCVGFRQNACALFVAYNLLRMDLVNCGCDVWLVSIMEIRWLLECGWRALTPCFASRMFIEEEVVVGLSVLSPCL